MEGKKSTAVKNGRKKEPYLQGHFPNHPIMPGVLQLEAMAQVAGILTLKQAENFGKLASFMAAGNGKWRKPGRPGDRLVIGAEWTETRGTAGKRQGSCRGSREGGREAGAAVLVGR